MKTAKKLNIAWWTTILDLPYNLSRCANPDLPLLRTPSSSHLHSNIWSQPGDTKGSGGSPFCYLCASAIVSVIFFFLWQMIWDKSIRRLPSNRCSYHISCNIWGSALRHFYIYLISHTLCIYVQALIKFIQFTYLWKFYTNNCLVDVQFLQDRFVLSSINSILFGLQSAS